MRLQAQAPARVLQAGSNAQGGVVCLCRAIHGLQKAVFECARLCQRGQVQSGLGPDDLEFLALALYLAGALPV